jgi:hypothetical protein
MVRLEGRIASVMHNPALALVLIHFSGTEVRQSITGFDNLAIRLAGQQANQPD